MSAIKHDAIIFDVGKVLIDWQPADYFRQHFDNDGQHRYFMDEVIPLSWHTEQDRGRPIIEAVAERQKLFPDYSGQIAAFYDNWLETIPGEIAGMDALVSELADGNLQLHGITNFSAELWPMTVEAYPLLQRLETVIVSGEVKLVKPDPAIYQLLLERVGLTAPQCLFIDDSIANTNAAAGMGFDTVTFENADQLRGELLKRGILASD